MKRNVVIIAALLIMMFCGGAQADIINYSGALNGSSFDPYPNPFLPLRYDGSIALTKFNPDMGKLNSLTIGLSSVFTYQTRFENESPSAGSVVTKNLDQQLTIGTLLDTGKVNYTRNWSVGAYDGTINYAGTSGFTVTENSGLTNVHLVFTGTDMATYVGTGNLLLDVFSHASFKGGFTGGNGSFLNSQTFATTANITYDYTPVPVPAAFWLLGSGLVGLVGLRRKMRINS